MKRATLAAALAAAGLLSAGTATSGASHVPAFQAAFTDNPFTGGQVAPRSYRWVNERASVFAQFDNPREPTALRYVGIGVKGTFCAESQPHGPQGGFTHFHRLSAPVYAEGHGGPPGTEDYWLLWVATDQFASFDGRLVKPGVDYQFSPTPAPGCNAAPAPSFRGPGAHDLSRAEIRRLARFFQDQPLLGGQAAPRFYRWLSADVAVFLQFDSADLRKARRLRYIGIAKRGRFTAAERGTRDFSSFQRLKAKSFRKGLGGKSGALGLWHLAVAVDRFRMPWGRVEPGVDRRYYRTPVPKG
jgi:hypothetical protein